jgi:hypothetical protein
MNESNLETETDAFRARFMSHVPEASPDNSLVVLKGHLLAEEILGDFISTKVSYPEHLRLTENHWGFSNKVELASSLARNDHHDIWVWHALKKLNSLRNKLSHSLEPKGLEKVINDLRVAVSPHAPQRFSNGELTVYGCVLLTVSGLFVVVKSEGGAIV